MATDRPSAVRMFAPDHPALARTLRQKIEKQVQEQATQLAGGYAADWGDYQKRVGTIKGLTIAADLCAETEKDLKD